MCILQGPTDDQAPLTMLRKIYLSLQPTTAEPTGCEPDLAALQGSLQQWLEGEIVSRVNSVIDL